MKKYQIEAANKILREGSKRSPRLSFAYINKDKEQVFCDGVRILRLKEHLPIPMKEDEYEAKGLTNVFESHLQHNYSFVLPLPKADYQKIIKESGKSRTEMVPYEVYPEYKVDLRMLMPILDILKNPQIGIPPLPTHPILFQAENGKALLAPLK